MSCQTPGLRARGPRDGGTRRKQPADLLLQLLLEKLDAALQPTHLITRTLIEIAYLVTTGDEVVLTGVTTHACVNPEGRPMRVPDWLLDLAEGDTALRD